MTKKILIIISLIVFAVFIIKKSFFFQKNFLDNWASNLTYPVVVATSVVTKPIKNFFVKRKNYKEIKKTLDFLVQENEDLYLENIRLQETIRQLNLSCDIIDFQERYNLKNKVFAKILVKNITPQEHFFLINRGSKDGVKKDMAAVYKFQLVGKVVDVNSFYSKVLLITDHNCKVSAFTNMTEAQGIVSGKNNIKSCRMEYVSHLEKIQDQDLVLSSGQGLVFPEGFCLGKIKKFKVCDLNYKISIEPMINLSQIKYCLIMDQEKIPFF